VIVAAFAIHQQRKALSPNVVVRMQQSAAVQSALNHLPLSVAELSLVKAIKKPAPPSRSRKAFALLLVVLLAGTPVAMLLSGGFARNPTLAHALAILKQGFAKWLTVLCHFSSVLHGKVHGALVKPIDLALQERVRLVVADMKDELRGKDGEPGEPGKDGKDGKDGVEGKQGPQGPPGKDGKDGKDGVEGKQGPAGPQGPKGPPGNGLPGKEGKQGPQGPQGATGPRGPPGKDGKDGKDGVEGKQGPQGPPGKDGLNGKDGTDGKDAPPAQIIEEFEKFVKNLDDGKVSDECKKTLLPVLQGKGKKFVVPDCKQGPDDCTHWWDHAHTGGSCQLCGVKVNNFRGGPQCSNTGHYVHWKCLLEKIDWSASDADIQELKDKLTEINATAAR
jgi:hypothetical protein